MRVGPGDPVTILQLCLRVTGGTEIFYTFPDFAIYSSHSPESSSDSVPLATSLSSEFISRSSSDSDVFLVV